MVRFFYLGGKVFGVYQGNLSRDNALHFARRLLGRLKREGAHYVHIGISLVHEQENNPLGQLLDDCWQALEIAEQRGPFSLCESSFLHHRHIHPLVPPTQEVVNMCPCLFTAIGKDMKVSVFVQMR